MILRPPSLFCLAAIATALLGASPAAGQGAACQIARAELAALDRSAGRSSVQSRAADLEGLIQYYRAAGCAGSGAPFMSARLPQCDQIHARITHLQTELSGNRGGAARRAQLQTLIEQQCSDGTLRASSRGIDSPDMGSSRIIIDENDQFQLQQSTPRPLGRAMCVRACDGYYFPLTTAPGGREGADDMCQALCPASPTRAYFLDGGSIDGATNSAGARYASSPNAYQFKRQISASCGCRRPGETWSTALKRADELAGPQAGETTTENGVAPPAGLTLRPGAGVQTKRAPGGRLQAIDPEPLTDDGPLEPEFIPPEPSGIAVMKPIAPPPAPPVEPAKPATETRTQVDGPRQPARVIGPPVKYESGRPIPVQSQ